MTCPPLSPLAGSGSFASHALNGTGCACQGGSVCVGWEPELGGCPRQPVLVALSDGIVAGLGAASPPIRRLRSRGYRGNHP